MFLCLVFHISLHFQPFFKIFNSNVTKETSSCRQHEYVTMRVNYIQYLMNRSLLQCVFCALKLLCYCKWNVTSWLFLYLEMVIAKMDLPDLSIYCFLSCYLVRMKWKAITQYFRESDIILSQDFTMLRQLESGIIMVGFWTHSMCAICIIQHRSILKIGLALYVVTCTYTI